MLFSHWTVSPVTARLGEGFNPRDERTTLVMPSANMTLTANHIAAGSFGFLSVTVQEQNATENQDIAVAGVQWSPDNVTWVNVNDGEAYPIKSGKGTVYFRANDSRWLPPPRQTFTLTADATVVLQASATRVSVVTCAATGPGTVLTSPVNGQVLASAMPVTLTAKPEANAVFVDWSHGDRSATTKVAPSRDTTYTARFRLKSECALPAVGYEPSVNAMVGVPYFAQVTVNDGALPVKFYATGLPAGLRLDATSGLISGVPTATNKLPFMVTFKAVGGATGKIGTLDLAIPFSALLPTAQGVFNGFVANDNQIAGSFNASVSSLGAITAKLLANTGTTTFSSPSWSAKTGDVFYASLTTANKVTLTLVLDTSRGWAEWQMEGQAEGDAFGEEGYPLMAQRNPFINKRDATYVEAMATNALYAGYYTFAAPLERVQSNGEAEHMPLGNSYFTATVGKDGSVKFAGALADGSAFSGSSVFMLSDSQLRIPFFFPLYAAKGFISGCLEVGADRIVHPSEVLPTVWSYPGRTPTVTPPRVADRFSLELAAQGGWYGETRNLAAYYSNSVFIATNMPGVGYTYVSANRSYTNQSEIVHLPAADIIVDRFGNIALPAGRRPVSESGGNLYSVTNAALATLSATRETGLFAGTFNIYYEYVTERGALGLRTVNTPHKGILTPALDGSGQPLGWGFYLLEDVWRSADSPVITYPLKRSYGVTLEQKQDGSDH
jgi:hypothetical protein